jgi:hypothetical protein
MYYYKNKRYFRFYIYVVTLVLFYFNMLVYIWYVCLLKNKICHLRSIVKPLQMLLIGTARQVLFYVSFRWKDISWNIWCVDINIRDFLTFSLCNILSSTPCNSIYIHYMPINFDNYLTQVNIYKETIVVYWIWMDDHVAKVEYC